MRNTFRLLDAQLERLEHKLARLETLTDGKDGYVAERMRALNSKYEALLAAVYSNLSAWETVQLARHARRPRLRDYLEMIASDVVELHGDRIGGDDRAVLTAFARIGMHRVMIVGHDKGRSLAEKRTCNFGHAHPEGHRKALAKMRLAEKYGVPVVCLIDTPGADPGSDSERHGQARAIAVNLMEMSRLRVPIVCVVTGEGGSGGALAIGVGDRLAIMQYAYLSVISPEGCASILFRDAGQWRFAAEALRLTSRELLELGYADAVVPEPTGGAHHNPKLAARYLKKYIVETLKSLRGCDTSELLERRYARLRRFGRDMVRGLCDPL